MTWAEDLAGTAPDTDNTDVPPDADAGLPPVLVGLVEKTASDPGAPFAPPVVAALAKLKTDNIAAFEALRARLKKAGCRVAALDGVIAAGGGEGAQQSDVEMLLAISSKAALFHSADRTAYADVTVEGRRETYAVRGEVFRQWLAHAFYRKTGGAPSSEALSASRNVIEAQARFDGPEKPVFVRVGGLDGKLYLDLGNATWRAIEIDATGWRVIDAPPVRFRRAAGMQALPEPVRGGSVEALRTFINVKSDSDFVLAVAWLLAALRNSGPYPVLVVSGEPGSAKSTFASILRSLVDPNTAPLRALPREDSYLFIAANNGHALVFDNISSMPAWLADTLCRLATGGGFATRTLYSDQDETIFDAARPVVLNGITDIATRSDLADRAILLVLEPIPEEKRRPEAEVLAAFDAERPRILGALLHAVVEGVRRLPETSLPRLPRMADFALWASACETALWPAGTFWAAYESSRDDAIDTVLDNDAVATTVRRLMQDEQEWAGAATQLLVALSELAGERVAKTKGWPASASALSTRLRRVAPVLRKRQIHITFEKTREHNPRRVVRITAGAEPPEAEPEPEATHADGGEFEEGAF